MEKEVLFMNLLQKPTLWVATAIFLTLLSFGLNTLFPNLVTFKASLLIIGFIVALSGFSIACAQNLHGNISNGVLALTTFGLSLTLFITTNSMDSSWDSLILASSVFTAVSFFVGIFALLPLLAKKNHRNLFCIISFCQYCYRCHINRATQCPCFMACNQSLGLLLQTLFNFCLFK